MASSRVALVTGATSGIGLGIARTLSRTCDVILTGLADRSTEHELLDEIERSSTRASFFVGGNLTSKQGVGRLCEEVNVLSPAGVDILINNAGIQHVSPLEHYPESKWHEMIAVHLTASFMLTRHFMPAMKTKVSNKIKDLMEQD